MPEVAEVAHVCALLKRNVLGFRIKNVNLSLDTLLFPILKESKHPDAELEDIKSKLLGSRIDSVGRHGKYFWLRLTKEEVPKSRVLLMHFGMTGMIKIRNVKSHLVFMENGGDKKILKELNEPKKEGDVKVEIDHEWPPRFSKFEMDLAKDDFKLEISFADPRRLGRVRLISDELASTDEGLLQLPPLDALGPDYSKSKVVKKDSDDFVFGDPDPCNHGRPRLSLLDFNELILSKKKPIKSLLLDQAYFAGVGNWVADEVLFHAKLHPNEIISSKIENNHGTVHPVVQGLYESLIYVCEEAVKCEGDSKKFPSHWLMLHRWGKARKNQGKAKTKEGFVLDHITVGGRTSCYAPEVQRLLKKELVANGNPEKRKRKQENELEKPVNRRTRRRV
ncbi:Formamidopyrimidine-DNA glycosylase H2TH domain family protein [Candida parapsilosis]|uniref:DNA-(apurinic or apyrimidinic site) lyase n=2 Tax=Candida parapsilosis TaxID=5480 RepID=G8B5C2_CANPC|nr:uncharacterized protein CPAR2_602320 [Candida parapsilosis]KAF6043521.1 Formamidopyrimidine-DNA glycosylase H2TH domain family protein [Candida parapsilosis]KAF6043981.1 Formamidopyrimidine-DNA glycosylase H2TH domain family protein [Candida parapsilosis]KAF6045399.1 Formamidopyrimidine-DNA glycosylase H2TH domain family protein [Candida parapsilosis]KAF6060185.1 Formamidopyrimidine-DNA glycosylase H2TH domain family protein [Candida parapsilosis]KAI5901606.1 Formamidopyrimidine-DNA glycosy